MNKKNYIFYEAASMDYIYMLEILVISLGVLGRPCIYVLTLIDADTYY